MAAFPRDTCQCPRDTPALFLDSESVLPFLAFLVIFCSATFRLIGKLQKTFRGGHSLQRAQVISAPSFSCGALQGVEMNVYVKVNILRQKNSRINNQKKTMIFTRSCGQVRVFCNIQCIAELSPQNSWLELRAGWKGNVF